MYFINFNIIFNGKLCTGSPENRSMALKILKSELGISGLASSETAIEFETLHHAEDMRIHYFDEYNAQPCIEVDDDSDLIDVLGIDKYLDLMSKIEDELLSEQYMSCMGEYGSDSELECAVPLDESWMCSSIVHCNGIASTTMDIEDQDTLVPCPHCW